MALAASRDMETLFDHLRVDEEAAASAEKRALVVEVQRRLCKHFGCPVKYFHTLDPLSELVSSMLSHRTRNRDSGQAYRNLRATFGDWNAVADAEVAAVELAISPCTWPEHKAPAIQRVLRTVREKVGDLNAESLDFLAKLPVPEARAWLEALPGVGPKTSAATLSFSTLRMRALPVDSHHHRVAQRLELIGPKVDVGPSHAELAALLPDEWDSQDVYDHHEVLMFLGQQICHWRSPACSSCPLLDLCPTGRERASVPHGD